MEVRAEARAEANGGAKGGGKGGVNGGAYMLHTFLACVFTAVWDKWHLLTARRLTCGPPSMVFRSPLLPVYLVCLTLSLTPFPHSPLSLSHSPTPPLSHSPYLHLQVLHDLHRVAL